ncbi:TPM domain-containing protein [Halomonas saccharevitans]|uniref:TLP18.3, Psb32 and MOLO-1 founding protein of phosphatase n=1 Tax=Halomonas saccharevitans TaxID=416872 RepID=A0A1I7C632_9GAMM|nr:TPM domain-containing protein [Halomonas saccharevitans]SFT94834.1 TLP18.3, Psb32 and MOLO-1 founding protein of phosphatase [Halomonas saccharevitans]
MIDLLRIPLLALLLSAALGLQAQDLQAQESDARQLDFPELTGRVVDRADLLDQATESRLSVQLAAHEEATTEQLVVATLPDLQGVTIEEYGYQLGRHWGIGQEEKDNGALLIVAPKERKVRIEVGYGLA